MQPNSIRPGAALLWIQNVYEGTELNFDLNVSLYNVRSMFNIAYWIKCIDKDGENTEKQIFYVIIFSSLQTYLFNYIY